MWERYLAYYKGERVYNGSNFHEAISSLEREGREGFAQLFSVMNHDGVTIRHDSYEIVDGHAEIRGTVGNFDCSSGQFEDILGCVSERKD